MVRLIMKEPCKVLYPKQFASRVVRTHWDYEEDLFDIIDKSGFKEDFTGMYINRLRFLEERMSSCVQRSSWFEKLKRTDDLYSIKIDSMKNIRILFAFVKYKGTTFAILLYPFEEKNKNKGGNNSYDSVKPIAFRRLREVLENE